MSSGPRTGRKDLQDFRKLSRAPVLSYLQKQAQPKTPRRRTLAAAPVRHPLLAAFAPQRIWTWFREYLRFRIGPKHAFLEYDDTDSDSGVYRLTGAGSEIRIALAGDWASGTDEAAAVATQITEYQPHYSIHLGDVYYVGDTAEVGENFLGIPNPANDYLPCTWPKGSEGTFALNGNHEMYARGLGYFDCILPALGLRGSSRGQRASYFCLENDDWRIIALDTGYNSVGLPIVEYILRPDCALPQQVMNWLRAVVRPRPDDRRGIVILTHHQYYSRFDRCYPKPAQQLAEFFSRPVLWLWGHEHRLVIYQEAGMPGGVRAYGRCIGHGGMPVDLPAASVHDDFGVEFIDTRRYPNDEGLTVGVNGFVKMTLRGKTLTLDYVDLNGQAAFREVWAVTGGVLVRTTSEASPGLS